MDCPIITSSVINGSDVRLTTATSPPVGATKILWYKKQSTDLYWESPVEVSLSGTTHDFTGLTGTVYFKARFASETEMSADSNTEIAFITPESETGTVSAYFLTESVGANGNTEQFASDVQSDLIVTINTATATANDSTVTIMATAVDVIYSSMAQHRTHFFTMNDKCYIMDGTNYLQFDGSSVVDVSTVAYVPTILISSPPAGGGTSYEDFNLLGAGFIQSFDGDGVATVYQLGLTGLDVTAITASIDGGVTYNKVETTHFTVNRTTGAVTWLSAPPSGTNNVKIKAYKTQSGFANRIKKCTIKPEFFGGANDTRVFVSGNPDYPNQMWRSALYDPTYFPENGYTKVGGDTAIKAFAKQYDTLLIIKEPSQGSSPVWSMSYNLESGVASFPIKPVNDQIGCKASETIQVVNNFPTWLSDKGVQRIVSSSVRDERNVEHVSKKVEPNLLNEANLENAVAIDFDNKYWLAVNGNVYVWDYNYILPDNPYGEWVLLDNIHASCFLEKDGYLYFGSSTTGLVYKFKKKTDSLPYNDDGEEINAYWKSKQTSFFADERYKMVDRVFVSLKPDYKASADVYYISNKKESDLLKSVRMDLLDFSNIDFNNFSFMTSSFPQESMVKIKAKKIQYFQLVLKNDNLDESMGILSVGIKHRYQAEVK